MMPRTPSALRRLKKTEIELLRKRFEESAAHGDTPEYRSVYHALQVRTRIDLPLGEVLNPRLAGWLLGWQMAGHSFTTGPITGGHRFIAQGIEGLMMIEGVSLAQALLASDETGLYRIEIFVPRKWRVLSEEEEPNATDKTPV